MQHIIYCRKSSESDERQSKSLDAQERELKELLRENLTFDRKTPLKDVVEVYRESMSAKEPGRPKFNKMIKEIKDEEIDVVVCWKLDRLARNPIDASQVQWLLQQGELEKIITPQRTYHPEDNVLLMNVQFGMSTQYSRDLSENVKRGNREKLEQGEWPNRAPWGYVNDKAENTVKPDPDKEQYVREIFQWYATGNYSFKDIADKLYEKGVRTNTGNRVHKSTVERVIENPFYHGMMEFNGELYPGNHDPLIGKKLYDQAQQARKQNRRQNSRPKSLHFPMRGFMQCAECGCQLTATRKKDKYDYYYCTNAKDNCDQHKDYLNSSDAEELFMEAFSKIKFDEKIVDIMYRAAKEKQENNEDNVQKQLDHFNSELEKLDEKVEKLLDSYTSDLIDKELYEKKVKEIENKRATLKQQRGQYKQKDPTSESTLEQTKSVFLAGEQARSEFLYADDDRKEEIIENVLWNFQVKDKNITNISYKEPYSLLAETPEKADFEKLWAV